MKYIDLSVPLNEHTPVYPGDPKTKIQPAGIFDKDGYEDHYVSTATHTGTHIDAPRHMIKDGRSLDSFSIDNFIGRGVLIKVIGGFDLVKVKKIDIKSGDVVLFNTGMSKVYFKPEYFDNYPAINKEVAEYLVSKKVKMVGVDTLSVDREPFSVHKILLGSSILIIENLTNLEVLDGKNFNVYALPLKLQVDGSPARVIAEINEG